jgi:hypothetical protein
MRLRRLVGVKATGRRIARPTGGEFRPARARCRAEALAGLNPAPQTGRSAIFLCAIFFLAAAAGLGATRPRYGGTLRVETHESLPEQAPAGFGVARFEAGRHASYAADENAPGGRPFLDGVEIEMGRPQRDQSIDLEVGKADLVEVGPNGLRRQPNGRKIWSSQPVRVVALVFASRLENARVREALALAVDRTAILNVLLQHQGEISGALLPQWLSGYAFLFPAASDIGRARAIVAGVPAAARALTLAADGPALRPIAERIALNAHDAGLAVTVASSGGADVRLVELRIASSDPNRALAGIASALRLPEPPPADSPEALYAAERGLLEGFRIVPLFHLPVVYAAGPRVHGGPGISPLGEFEFEDVWVEGGRQ